MKNATDRNPHRSALAFISLRVFIVVSSRSPQRVHPRRIAIGLGATVCAIVISSPTDTTSPEARQDDPVNRIVLYSHIAIRLSTLLGAVRKPRLGLEPNLQHPYAPASTPLRIQLAMCCQIYHSVLVLTFGHRGEITKRRSTATIRKS